MRSLSAYLDDQKKRAADDRDLTSRSDRRKGRKEIEEAYSNLARELCDCSGKLLKQLELPELLLNCVLDARRIDSPSAKDRALRLVRRELRNGDAEAIRRQVDKLKDPKQKSTPKPETQWAERILQEGEPAVNAFVGRFPGAARQPLNQLLRNARKAQGEAQTKAKKLLAARLAEFMREQDNP